MNVQRGTFSSLSEAAASLDVSFPGEMWAIVEFPGTTKAKLRRVINFAS